jgi:hypothetical protein
MPAPYMGKKTGDALAEDWKLQPDFQRLVRTHARVGAAIAEGGRFPVILLEHGLGVVPRSTQFWLRVWRAADSLWSPPIIPLSL